MVSFVRLGALYLKWSNYSCYILLYFNMGSYLTLRSIFGILNFLFRAGVSNIQLTGQIQHAVLLYSTCRATSGPLESVRSSLLQI